MTRVISGAVLVVLVVGLVWFAPPIVFEAFAILVALGGTWELTKLVPAAVAIPMALVYLALPLAALVQIRLLAGPQAVFLVMLTIMVSDTAQYYTGRTFGRRPLAPTISPKKTQEGAAGGFVFGTLLFVVLGAWWAPALTLAARVAVGLAIVALGIAGDLFESFLKRRAGVKDSSHLIPGHGGVLDRIDALLFAAPAYWAALKLL
ncbi:MAG TPA: phosphatidate cytidylyltransferase [Vicinamibacterales bacterium]|nr:phosphatidate cytidylyltransferase [Vicinamibacterales bacterium]